MNGVEQATEWSCSQEFNYTTTTILTVVRKCIPRIFNWSCTSTGTFYATFLTCECDTDGCNSYVVELENETTTMQPTTTDGGTTTVGQETTTPADNGAVNLRLSTISVIFSVAVFRLFYIWSPSFISLLWTESGFSVQLLKLPLLLSRRRQILYSTPFDSKSEIFCHSTTFIVPQPHATLD